MSDTLILFCLTLVAIVALGNSGSGGNSGTANKAIDTLKSVFTRKK